MQTPWADWEADAKRRNISELRYIIKDCREAEQAMRGGNPEKEGFYSDQAATYAMELGRRLKA